MAPKNAFSSSPAVTYLYCQALVYTAAFRLNRQWLSPQNTLSLMEAVCAFRLRDRYFVYPNKRTTAGLWIAQPEFKCLPLDATPESLGLVILAAFAQSHGVIAHPTDWSALSKSRLAAAGVRSERAFMLGSRLVQVERGECFRFEPTRNGGSSGDLRGFARTSDGLVSLPLHSLPGAVGEAFLNALEECAVET